jgi:glycosyltransferase involved in cell wall biosynthesis
MKRFPSILRTLSDLPTISIITSTFNARDGFQATAESIRRQTHGAVQWIVADGGSTDGTVDMIRRCGNLVSDWFSEPDHGIYDAWNKALCLAKGDWIQFLGAGDELATPHSLAEMAGYLGAAYPQYDIVYGRIQLVSEKGRRPLEQIGAPWSELKGRWNGRKPRIPVHPEVFHHRSILQGETPFDPRFRIAGDSHLLLRNMLKKDPLYVPVLVDIMPVGGVSDRISSARAVARELDAINRDLGIRPPVGQVMLDTIQVLSKEILPKVLPGGFVSRIGDLWRILRGKKPRFSVD